MVYDRRHLTEDISPYTCLLEDCPIPFAIYATQQDWENHVENKHPPRRLCPFCLDMSAIFTITEAFREHLKVEHGNMVSESLIMAVASHSRVVTIGVTDCPLCDTTGSESDPGFITHLLNCKHDFSLRSLPWSDHSPYSSRRSDTHNLQPARYKSTTNGWRAWN
jgi:hypothetical protein